MPRRRRRGTGTVFFSKSRGRWIARVPLGGGRFRSVSAGTPTAARLALDSLQRDAVAGDLATRPLDEYLAAWLVEAAPRVRPSTMTSYAGHVRMHISPLLGGIIVSRLGPQDVRRLIADRLAAGLSPTTVGRIVTTLRMALGVAVRDGLLPRNPASVPLPRVERRQIEALTPERARAILRAVADDELGPLYTLLLGSGLRLGEACALDWSDVDLAAGTVRVRSGKTRAAARVVGVPPFVVASLRRQAKGSRLTFREPGPSERMHPVFLGPRTGKRLRPDTATHHLGPLLERHGLPRMRVHDLRHGHATLLLAAGTPMRVIADQLGHASPAITANVYAHVVPALQREAVARLQEVVEG